MRSINRERPFEIWPGFVDALSALLLVILFTLMIFVVAQFYLSNALQERKDSVNTLQASLQKLSNLLAREEEKNAHLVQKNHQLTQQRNRLKENLSEEEAQKHQAHGKLKLIEFEMQELNSRLEQLLAALSLSKTTNENQQLEIETLQLKLNEALEEKMKELAGYRSEFFGNLRKLLGNRDDIQIVGDRFVFQSEVLFNLGSDQLGIQGKKHLKQLAKTLKEIEKKIPKHIPWILRVDGHTDKLPLRSTGKFKDNWELSTARSLCVVHYLIQQGIAPHRLAGAGFGEFHPISLEDSRESMARNRRIEIKLDQR